MNKLDKFAVWVNNNPFKFFGSLVILFVLIILAGTGTITDWLYPHLSNAEQKAQDAAGLTTGGWIALSATFVIFAIIIYYAIKERAANANKYFGKDAGTGYDKDLEK